MSSGAGWLQGGEVVRIRAERWVVERVVAHGEVVALDVRGAEVGNRSVRTRFLTPFERVERVVISDTPRVVRPATWRRGARAVLAAATPGVHALRTAAGACFDVLPYQLEPALALTAGLGCRLLIADEVGLGKTVQAGLIVAEVLRRTPDGRALVVCPAGLRTQWTAELEQRFGLAPALLDAAGVARAATSLAATANPWSAVPLIITSIDYVKRAEVMRALEGLVWDVLVLDEAHHLATRTDRGIAASSLALRARTVVMLSATPHSGDDAAFSRLCALGDLHGRFPLLLFRRTRNEVGATDRRRTRWLRVRLSAAEREMHAGLLRYAHRVWDERGAGDPARLAISVLLRRGASSAASLVRSLERRLEALAGPVTAGAAQLQLPFAIGETDEEPATLLAVPALTDGGEERRYLEHVLALARLAALGESKVGALHRWIARVREPVLVFTEYRDTLAHVRRRLTALQPHLRIVELHGALTRSERRAAEHAFVAADADVLLATDAASEGLNLHRRSRCVVSLETPWNPVRLEQRIGRLDRIGQQRRVHALQLVGAGTIELETVRRVHQRSRRAASALEVPANDLETTTALLTGVDFPSRAPATDPRTFVRPDLEAAAAAEAARIVHARRLQAADLPRDRRAQATTFARTAHQAILAFDVALVDRDRLPVWDTVVGLALECSVTTARPADTREAIARLLTRRSDVEHLLRHRLFTADLERWQSAVAARVTREQAIAAAIRVRHARIASELLQPGLFDRRAECRAASQTAILEEALGRCTDRLDALERMQHVRIADLVLRFAVLRR